MTSKQKPILQLDHYFVLKLSCEANPDYDLSAPAEEIPPGISADVALDDDDDGKVITVRFLVANADDDTSVPYEFELSMFAVFHAYFDLGDDKRFGIALRNAISILYGAARDLLLTVTGRGPWPPYMLPAVSPQDLLRAVSIGRSEPPVENEQLEDQHSDS